MESEPELRKYLLGDLNRAEHLQVEERLFLEHDYFQLLRSAEDDLIEEYVYDELPADEREKFEKHFLSELERHDDVRLANALKKYASANAAGRAPALGEEETREAAKPIRRGRGFFGLFGGGPVAKLSLAFAALAVVFAGTLIVVNLLRWRSPPDSARMQSPERSRPSGEQQDGGRDKDAQPETKDAQGEPEQRAQQPGQSQPSQTPEKEEAATRKNQAVNKNNGALARPPLAVYAALLMPGSAVRESGETNQIRLPASAALVDLQLPLINETGYHRYQATLQTDAGDTIITRSGLKHTLAETGRVVTLRVPAESLRPGRYRVSLTGVQNDGSARDISSYFFQILK